MYIFCAFLTVVVLMKTILSFTENISWLLLTVNGWKKRMALTAYKRDFVIFLTDLNAFQRFLFYQRFEWYFFSISTICFLFNQTKSDIYLISGRQRLVRWTLKLPAPSELLDSKKGFESNFYNMCFKYFHELGNFLFLVQHPRYIQQLNIFICTS